MRSLISYDRYTEFLSKRIHRSITPAEAEDTARFEVAQPQVCPKCHTPVHGPVLRAQIVHDMEKCQGKPATT